MDLIDFILNLAALLLWLSWSSVRFDPLAQAKARTLVGTLKQAKAPVSRRWMFLAAIGALLVVRAWGYRQVGSALDWTPTLDLGATVLPFRSDYFVRVLLFSVLGFLRTLAVFYAGLVFLVILNRRLAGTDPFQKLARLHLGFVARWPGLVLALLAVVLGVAVWMALHPLFTNLGIAPRVARSAGVFQQGLLVVAGELLTLRYLVAAFLVAHLLNSYVYLGDHAIWNFVNETGRNLLRPLRWAPLRIGRVDFAPVVAIALVFAIAEFSLSLIGGHLPRWLHELARSLGINGL